MATGSTTSRKMRQIQKYLGGAVHVWEGKRRGVVGYRGCIRRINSSKAVLCGWASGRLFHVRLRPYMSWRWQAPSRSSSLQGTTAQSFPVFRQRGNVIRLPCQTERQPLKLSVISKLKHRTHENFQPMQVREPAAARWQSVSIKATMNQGTKTHRKSERHRTRQR